MACLSKSTIYFDSSFISAYWYEGANLSMLARRFYSREWWMFERKQFEVFASVFVEGELLGGKYGWKRNCVGLVRRLKYLPIRKPAVLFANDLMENGVIPQEKKYDAIHLALATMNKIDYLLTWNYKHLPNPMVQARLNELCRHHGIRPPLLVSPESIPQTRFGSHVRRRK